MNNYVSCAPANEPHLFLLLRDTLLIIQAVLLAFQVVCTVTQVTQISLLFRAKGGSAIFQSVIHQHPAPNDPKESTTDKACTLRATRSALTMAFRDPGSKPHPTTVFAGQETLVFEGGFPEAATTTNKRTAPSLWTHDSGTYSPEVQRRQGWYCL